MKMKVSDYIAAYLADNLGLRHVFVVSGAANMHILDSLAKNPKIDYICTHHEQSGSIAAEAYARAGGGMGAMISTTGPGGINAINGAAGAWFDSTPCLFISGQVNLSQFTDGKTIRQYGVQQANIIEIVRSITKYAAMVTDAADIKFHLDKAFYLAKSGRPGPVWLDIPTNIQHSEIEPSQLRGFEIPNDVNDGGNLKNKIIEVIRLIKNAKRPVLIAGNGIRLSGAQNEFLKVVDLFKIPVITTWNGIDLIWSDHPYYVGRCGFYGQRAGNFAVANSDLILSIGSRLDTKQVGNNSKAYARGAKKIVVDIDVNELNKGLIRIDLPVAADAKKFLQELLVQIGNNFTGPDTTEWLKKCSAWKEKYPATSPEYFEQTGSVNSFVFVDTLCKLLSGNDLIVTDMGTSLTGTMQAFKIKKGQRLFSNTGFASMGYGLPAAIGAWYGSGRDKTGERIICISGDGGLQMVIQELQTVKHYKIPIKLFLLNNNGYLTIRHTQDKYMGGKFAGSGAESGVSMPNFVEVARAYGLATEKINDHAELEEKIKKVLDSNGPVLCEIVMSPDQPLVPKLVGYKNSAGQYVDDPIEKMWPYLPEDEYLSNMIIPPFRG